LSILGLYISSSAFADQSQASCIHDSSILKISDDKCHLNPESLSFNEGKIYLNTDSQGWIQLQEVMFDGQNYFCGSRVLGVNYICLGCSRMYGYLPSKCPKCGGTEFYLSDMYPEKS